MIYGGCGVAGCIQCLPLYDDDNREIPEEELPPMGPELPCGCRAHVTRMSGFGTALYCETEQNAYCNFEHLCGAEDEDER